MTAIAHRRMTLKEFLRLREWKPAPEFEDREVTQYVSPKAKRGALQREFVFQIEQQARPRRLAHVFPETRTTFAGRSYVPDVSVYRWERIPTTPEGNIADDFFLPPDMVVQIISPGQSITKLRERCRWYVANGVGIALLVAHGQRRRYRFHARDGEQALHGNDRIDLDEVLRGTELTPAMLCRALRMDCGREL